MNPLKSADENGGVFYKKDNFKKENSKTENAPVTAALKQQSFYNKEEKPSPDNSPFFEERGNAMSSKGN